jgi:ParB family chromosome partitioning protein
LEALNHNGIKGDKLSVDVFVEQTGESKNQIFRLIRLTELIITLLDKVDAKQLAFNPAVELSYLSQTEQAAVAAAMDKFEVKPSLSQAQRLKKMKQDGRLSITEIEKILTEAKKLSKNETTGSAKFRRYFPSGYSVKQMDDIITQLLKTWVGSRRNAGLISK